MAVENAGRAAVPRLRVVVLQCGHGSMAVENILVEYSTTPAPVLQCGHGSMAVENDLLRLEADLAGVSSMRPRQHGRGEPPSRGRRPVQGVCLQCGHGS